MKAYKFITTMRRDGMIRVPKSSGINSGKVEVTIVSDIDVRNGSRKAREFIKRWGGILRGVSKGDKRYEYLMGKHR